MIIISDALVLTETLTDVNNNNPIIGYQNRAVRGGIVAEMENPDFPASNLANPSTAELWKSDPLYGIDDQNITFTVGSAEDIDYFAMARHNFASSEISVSLWGRVSSVAAFFELVTPTMLPDDGPFLLRFVPQPLYELQLRLGVGNAVPQAAVAYLGKLLVLPRRIYVGQVPPTMARKREVSTGMSEKGNYLGRIQLSGSKATSFKQLNIDRDWYRANIDPFIAAGDPFFFAWRPGTFPEEVVYAWFTGDPQPSNQLPNGMMQVSVDFAGIDL